ncbi:MAG TPA: ABC transporter ATP-binding protein [Candidatus Bathyarchaeia archaeon]
MDLAIETVDLVKRYGSLTAVNKLNLQVRKGTIHGFLGPNGAGKTTTIKVLVGLLKPDDGTVRVFGEEVCGDRADVRLKMGYMPELPKFPKHLKGWELLDIYGRMYGLTKQQREEQIPKLLELVGLKGRERDLVGKYSKGMQQRIGIAQALLNEPELVILDEPSLGLDPVGMVEVRELMKGIAKEGMTVFISSHLLFEVEQICSHITIIHKGVSLVSDTLQNISKNFSGPATLKVEVAEPSDAIIQAVEKLPFVSSVSQEGKTLAIELKTRDDVRPQVSQEITKSGGVIVSMSLKGQSLEEVFMQLITKPQEGKKQ